MEDLSAFSRPRLAALLDWAIENKLHWVLDVTFGEDLSRLRSGHGAKNMAVVRHIALNLVRQVADKRSIKSGRKRAAWGPAAYKVALTSIRCPDLSEGLQTGPGKCCLLFVRDFAKFTGGRPKVLLT